MVCKVGFPFKLMMLQSLLNDLTAINKQKNDNKKLQLKLKKKS